MNDSWKLAIRNKGILALIIAVIFMVPITAVLTMHDVNYVSKRENEQLEVRKNIADNVVAEINTTLASAEERYARNLSAKAALMADYLKSFVSDKGYEGQRVFSDGFVAELKHGKAVLPEGITSESDLSEAMQNSAGSGTTVTAELRKGNGTAEKHILSFREITDGCFYAEMVPETEYEEYISRYREIDYVAMQQVSQVVNGTTLVVREQGGTMEIVRLYGNIGKYETLKEMGISEAEIRQEKPVLEVNGISYSCSYAYPETDISENSRMIMVQMLPKEAVNHKSLIVSMAISFMIFLVYITFIVYLIMVQYRVRTAPLSETQMRIYEPHRLRINMLSALVTGAVCVCLVTAMLHGIGQIYYELTYGEDTLDAVVQQINAPQVSAREVDKSVQEAWYVSCGQRMAALIHENPEAAESGQLKRWSDILDTDFIMLFDENGNETLCSSDYTGFTMSKGLGEDSADFRRLLMGIPSVVHEVSVDPATKLERQMIGVTLPMRESTGAGGLIMALLPGKIQETGTSVDVDTQLSRVVGRNAQCFVAMEDDGTIVNASDPSLKRYMVTELGLSEKSLRDGYVDFGVIRDEDCFVMTKRDENRIYYFATSRKQMREQIFSAGVLAAGLYAAGALLMILFLLAGYNQKLFRAMVEWYDTKEGRLSRIPPEEDKDGNAEFYDEDLSARLSGLTDSERAQNIMAWLKIRMKWYLRNPEEATRVTFHLVLTIILLLMLVLLLNNELLGAESESMLRFLLAGDWVKGANMLAFISIVLVIGIAYLVSIVIHMALRLISNFQMSKGKTICKLAESALRYLTMFVTVFFVFYYLGFPVSTILGSIGIVSLALSLGATGLVSDIIAGLAIVFEHCFQVGDIISIGDKKGMVQEIGIRTTKLMSDQNDLIVINNSSIGTITNHTRKPSWFFLEVNIPIETPLEPVEELLKRELPELGKKCDEIIGDPEYVGVTRFGSKNGYPKSSVQTLGILAKCSAMDLYIVNNFLNREILLLLKNEGYEIR